MTRFRARFVALALLSVPMIGSAAELNSEQLYEKFKPAVVKIAVYQQGVRVMLGSGFFVDTDGGVITNSHVAELALGGQFRAEFTTADGTVVKTFDVARCSDYRGIDLCYMRIPFKPKAWLDPKKTEFKVGQNVFTIGHPKGFDWTISQGLLSGIRHMSARGYRPLEGPNSVETIQINAPISPGNSGGPAFNAKGELIGVVTWTRIEVDSRELNFTISANEVVEFIEKSPPFISRQGYLDRKKANSKKIQASIEASVVNPAWDVLKAVEKARANVKQLDPAQWARLEIKTELGTFETFVPKTMIKNCRELETQEKTRFTECADGNGGVLQFRISPSQNPRADVKAFGKIVPQPIPFPFVKSMMNSGEWEEISKTLTPTQRKYLFSVPGKPKCKEYENSYFRRGKTVYECTSFIFNDDAPSASSMSIVLGQDDSPAVVRILGWTPGGLEGVYFAYASIAAQLIQMPTAGNPVVTAPASSEEDDSLKKLLTSLRNGMMTAKTGSGSYPRDLAKALSDEDLSSLNLPADFQYKIFVMPACARQSKPTDKTEITNVDDAKMKNASGAAKTAITRVMKASESMSDKLVDQRCPSPRENFSVIGVGYENETLTIALVDRRKVDILTRNGVKQ